MCFGQVTVRYLAVDAEYSECNRLVIDWLRGGSPQ